MQSSIASYLSGNNQDASLKQKFAYEKLKSAIITNKLLPETILVERDISDSMNLSRTPIREAFKQLESEGYVTRILGKGVFISKIHYEDFIEIYEIKEALESQAARLCAIRKTPKLINDLEYFLSEYKKAITQKKYNLIQEFDIKFHQTYIKGAHNRRLEKELQGVIEQTQRVLYAVDAEGKAPDYDYTRLISEHESILNGIKSSNPDLARKAASDHIENVKNSIKSSFYNL